MSPTLIVGALGLALSVGTYVVGRQDGRQLAEGEVAIAERVSEKAAQASRESSAEAIAKITVKHTTIQNRLEKEVRNVPVYTDPDCRLTPGGLRDLNAALAGAGPEPSAPELPASGASR